MKVYRDRNDWWVGYYRGDTHHYVCLLPTLVIRWDRPFEDITAPSWLADYRLFNRCTVIDKMDYNTPCGRPLPCCVHPQPAQSI